MKKSWIMKGFLEEVANRTFKEITSRKTRHQNFWRETFLKFLKKDVKKDAMPERSNIGTECNQGGLLKQIVNNSFIPSNQD